MMSTLSGNQIAFVVGVGLFLMLFAYGETIEVEGEVCSKSAISVAQRQIGLINGSPLIRVVITNVCGCNISGIHLSCGSFASAIQVNPKVFKRLQINNCIVNDGNVLNSGQTLSFIYANSFIYPLSVSHVNCP